MQTIPALFEHQQRTVKLLGESTSVFDMSDPGTGKTRSALVGFLNRFKADNDNKCALVLAPKSILRSAWGNDIKKFTPELSFSIAYASNREAAFKADANVYITNIDATKWLYKQKPEFFDKFSTIIIDEGTFYKHQTSARSKALAKIIKYFKFRELMTGTPNSNTITDIWHQVYLLDGGARLGKSFYAFRATACIPKQVGPSPNMVKWVDRPGVHEAVASLLSDITIRHKFEECTDIPANYEYTVPFDMSTKHRGHYEELRKTSVLELQAGDVNAIHAASLATKLLQVASGAAYGETLQGSKDRYINIDNDRYEMVIDIANQREHSIVFFLWTHQRDELVKQADACGLTYAVIDGDTSDTRREEIVELYQKGFYRILFAHPASAAHGLTLVKGTATIWASPPHNLDWFVQGNRRIYRTGQTAKTETIIIVATDTIEEKVYESLMNKNLNMQTLLGMV